MIAWTVGDCGFAVCCIISIEPYFTGYIIMQANTIYSLA